LDTLNHNRNDYLEKVFNVEINLLQFHSKNFKSELYKQIKISIPQNFNLDTDKSVLDTFRQLFQEEKNDTNFEINWLDTGNN